MKILINTTYDIEGQCFPIRQTTLAMLRNCRYKHFRACSNGLSVGALVCVTPHALLG